MKKLEDYGVQQLSSVEIQNVKGGNLFLELWSWYAEFYLDNFDPSVLPSGSLGGYTGCKL